MEFPLGNLLADVFICSMKIDSLDQVVNNVFIHDLCGLRILLYSIHMQHSRATIKI